MSTLAKSGGFAETKTKHPDPADEYTSREPTVSWTRFALIFHSGLSLSTAGSPFLQRALQEGPLWRNLLLLLRQNIFHGGLSYRYDPCKKVEAYYVKTAKPRPFKFSVIVYITKF